MNLTDNEIIKAIELCFSEDFTECEECPLKSERDGLFSCIPIKQKLILDLLTRLKAENKELQSELIITKNNFDNAKDRLEESIKIGQKMNEKLIDAYKKLQTAKTEAIKEFAEDLTNRICDAIEESMNNPNGDNYFITDVYGTIKDLVKELTEDKE